MRPHLVHRVDVTGADCGNKLLVRSGKIAVGNIKAV